MLRAAANPQRPGFLCVLFDPSGCKLRKSGSSRGICRSGEGDSTASWGINSADLHTVSISTQQQRRHNAHAKPLPNHGNDGIVILRLEPDVRLDPDGAERAAHIVVGGFQKRDKRLLCQFLDTADRMFCQRVILWQNSGQRIFIPARLIFTPSAPSSA